MKLFELVHGKMVPEVYSLGFTGTHFQFLVLPHIWLKIVAHAEHGTYFTSSQKNGFTPPDKKESPWGIAECATISHLLDGRIAINIPAVPIQGQENFWDEIRNYAHTISLLTRLFYHITAEQKKESTLDCTPQLFHINTYVGEAGQFHGAALDLSVSLTARLYLYKLGENIYWKDTVQSMENHFETLSPRENDSYSNFFSRGLGARLRERGLLDFKTFGDCACLGANPSSFGDEEGCYLSSHNVDNVVQQFNLLVAIASVWQKVADGIRN